ncbi:MAG: hypothetical protein A2W31_13285 [Planctomycetes bacterium RBG_16_64_10]|nr:MAG: hypothetical protein A2W31_13285 [Planctomycetes bacterium RBG_16_64_10]
MHRHLKTLGQAPVRLVLYPGEGHGNRRAAARLDFHLRMLQWMEHYLQGPGGAPPPFALDYAEQLDAPGANDVQPPPRSNGQGGLFAHPS